MNAILYRLKSAAMFLPAVLFATCFSQAAVATSVLPLTLEQMSAGAEIIFQGRVLDNAARRDEQSGRIATFTTFELIDIIRQPGTLAVGDTYTIKQVGGALEDQGVRFRVHGVPDFTVGEEYIVLLPPASKSGFTSPVGLGQGRFRVQRQGGTASVTNGRSIESLTVTATQRGPTTVLPVAVEAAAGLQALPGRPAHAGLDTFKSALRAAGERQ